MAQVMVNFRMDEELKHSMERVCREMGLSMTAAFTIFASKVAKEKRIPFELTASPPEPAPARGENPFDPASALRLRREWLEELYAGSRRALTAIHTAIPASMGGMSAERIRLLCGDELKDKLAAAANGFRSTLSERNAPAAMEKDMEVLDQYVDGFSAISEELSGVSRTLVPAMRAWTGEGDIGLSLYEQRLAAVSRQFDQLQGVMGRFLQSTAQRQGSARSVQSRLRRAGDGVASEEVRDSLESLETLILRRYDTLDRQTKTRLESHYLPTLELVLEELACGEREGEDTEGRAALCFRAINVLSAVVTEGSRTQRELGERGLEAEVAALERIAAMRGDV